MSDQSHVPGECAAVETIRAITLHQPWATLIALGAKTIETRGWDTYYRGPLAIHAGKSQRHIGIDFWDRHDAATAHRIHRALLDGGYGPSPAFPPFPQPSEDTGAVGVPLGAVVAVCTLADVVPMKSYGDQHPNIRSLILDEPHEGDMPHQQGGMWLIGPNAVTNGKPTRVEDQRPFGDYAIGRFAWLLTDIRPIVPVPMNGRQGLWTLNDAAVDAVLANARGDHNAACPANLRGLPCNCKPNARGVTDA